MVMFRDDQVQDCAFYHGHVNRERMNVRIVVRHLNIVTANELRWNACPLIGPINKRLDTRLQRSGTNYAGRATAGWCQLDIQNEARNRITKIRDLRHDHRGQQPANQRGGTNEKPSNHFQ